MSKLNFSSRLNGYDPEAPELLNLVNAVSVSADRAIGVLNSLFWLYQADGDMPSHNQISNALDSAILELGEIQMLMRHFYSSTVKEVKNVTDR